MLAIELINEWESNHVVLKSESGFVDAVELKLCSFYATENGIINAWTEYNGTMVPDVSVNTEDMFTIEL